MEEKINLTKGLLLLGTDDVAYGIHHYEIKCGRKTYMVDVCKNSLSIFVDVCNKLNKDRAKYSKYDAKADLHFISLKKHFLYFY